MTGNSKKPKLRMNPPSRGQKDSIGAYMKIYGVGIANSPNTNHNNINNKYIKNNSTSKPKLKPIKQYHLVRPLSKLLMDQRRYLFFFIIIIY